MRPPQLRDFSNVASVVGPHDPVAISPGCTWFDDELEVAWAEIVSYASRGTTLQPGPRSTLRTGF